MGYLVERDFRFHSLRVLRSTDVDGMLEWMHDFEIASVFENDFMSVTRDSALLFIESTHCESSSLHFAVVDSADEYLGTISLKSIDARAKEAEYAIAMRRRAHGTGAALIATRDLLNYAFHELGLRRVYLCVRPSNVRAVSFYRKAGFAECDGRCEDLLWFEICREIDDEDGGLWARK